MNDALPGIAAALGKIPSGVFIITARLNDRCTGMLASWVQQASFDPPMITLAVRSDRPIVGWLEQRAPVAVNVVSHGEKQILTHFARGFRPEDDAFVNVSLWDAGGAPVLADALAYLRGVPEGRLDAGDHAIFAIRVEAGGVLRDAAPMVHLRKSGMHY